MFLPHLVSHIIILLILLFTSGENAFSADSKRQSIPLTLDQAINLALQVNRAILSSQYSAESQRYSISSAQAEFETKIFPTGSIGFQGGNTADTASDLNLGFSVRKKLEAGTNLFIGPTLRKTFGEYVSVLSLAIEQPLFRGFGSDFNLNNIRAAEYSMKSIQRSLYLTRINTVLDVVSAYYDAIRYVETIRLYGSMAQRLRGYADVARAKEKVGLATAMDTYRAEIRLKDAEEAVTLATQAYYNAKDRLKISLALPLETEIELVTPERAEPSNQDLDRAVETALNGRIEIEQAYDDLQEAERKAAVARTNILPDLSLVLGYDRFDYLAQGPYLDQNWWSMRLQSTTDLLHTAERAAYQQSLITVNNLRMSLEGKRDEIRRQVRSQFIALREAEKRMAIRKEQIKQAEGKLALAEVKFTHGMADNFNLIEAETELQQARINLLSTEVDHTVGIYAMQAITGKLIERN